MAKKEEIDIGVELRSHIARFHKTQKAAAAWWGCSGAFLSQVLSGKKSPTNVMLREAGFARVEEAVHYVRVK